MSITSSLPPQEKSAREIQEKAKQGTVYSNGIRAVFEQMKPGQTLANAPFYLEKMKALQERTADLQRALDQLSGKIPALDINATQEALIQQTDSLRKTYEAAKKAGILPSQVALSPLRPPFSKAGTAPKGAPLRSPPLSSIKLWPGETELHAAAKRLDLQAIHKLRTEGRRKKLEEFWREYIKTIKDPNKAGKLLENWRDLPEALELFYFCRLGTPQEQEALFGKYSPVVRETLQTPSFLQALDQNEMVLGALNGTDIFRQADSRGITPPQIVSFVETNGSKEVQDQKAQAMELLLFPFFKNKNLKLGFTQHLNQAEKKMMSVRTVDPNTLSPFCRAVYLGNMKEVIEHLKKGAVLDKSDTNGLTPLQYAILSKHPDARVRAFIMELLIKSQAPLYHKGEKYSNLDCALSTGLGNQTIYQILEKCNSPFTLARKNEEYFYHFASGIGPQQMYQQMSQDPLLMAGQEQDLELAENMSLNINVPWLVAYLLHQLTNYIEIPGIKGLPWVGEWVHSWAAWGLQRGTHILHLLPWSVNQYGIGKKHLQELLPNRIVSQAIGALQHISNISVMIQETDVITKKVLPVIVHQTLQSALPYLTWANKVYVLLRLAAAANVALKEIKTVYRPDASYRPKAVQNKLCRTLGNFFIQIIMTYVGWVMHSPTAVTTSPPPTTE